MTPASAVVHAVRPVQDPVERHRLQCHASGLYLGECLGYQPNHASHVPTGTYNCLANRYTVEVHQMTGA